MYADQSLSSLRQIGMIAIGCDGWGGEDRRDRTTSAEENLAADETLISLIFHGSAAIYRKWTRMVADRRKV
jgi:hypothetical protein